MSAETFCPNCGARRPEGARFCASCGRPYADEPIRTQTPVVEQPVAVAVPQSAARRVATFVVVVGIILAATSAVLVLGGNTPSPLGSTGSADAPPVGAIWFGKTFDPQTFALTGRRTTIGTQEAFAMVAHLASSRSASDLVIRTSYNGQLVSSAAPNATGAGEIWGFSPGPLFAAGEWRYDLTDVGGNVLASGTVTAQ